MVKQDRLFFAQKLVILDIVLNTVLTPHTKQVKYCGKINFSLETRVSVQGVESLWGDCRFIPADWGS